MHARRFAGVYDAQGQITDEFAIFAMTELPGAKQRMRDHLQTGLDSGWAFLRFEDLKWDPKVKLAELVTKFDWSATERQIDEAISTFDFSLQRERNTGNAFFAQSTVASWTGLLSPAVLDLLEAEVGPTAQAFGYDLSQRPTTRQEG